MTTPATCPHLGLASDRTLARTQPDSAHRCYAQTPPAAPDEAQQIAFCLSANNPLQIVQSHLDLLLDFPMSDAEKREYLQIIRQQMQRLSRQVADALALTRPGPPRAPATPVSEPADVADVIQRVFAFVSQRLRQGGIQVDADLARPARALIPSDQLMQVCLNLVVNAIEALQGQANGHLQITTQSSGAALILSFCNNGPAIPPDVLPHVLEPFYTTKSYGSGLGLWVCYNILRKYGGALSVRNLADDQGVVFDLSLPAAYDKPEKSQ
ncbi:MAG: HAMP domain-containing histidine kinase [Chloroflexi bacterium]|nr:HAMP domain-containing histidine kinase [Chloroflexota bacterium]